MAAYAAFSSRNFPFLLAAIFLSNIGHQMLSVVVAWDLYVASHSPLVLGNVGLVQIVPVLLFTFAAGHVADHYSRRRTTILTQALVAFVGFVLAASGAGRGVGLIYSCLFLTATARAFQWPVTSALLPQVVEIEHLTSAISWAKGPPESAPVPGWRAVVCRRDRASETQFGFHPAKSRP